MWEGLVLLVYIKLYVLVCPSFQPSRQSRTDRTLEVEPEWFLCCSSPSGLPNDWWEKPLLPVQYLIGPSPANSSPTEAVLSTSLYIGPDSKREAEPKWFYCVAVPPLCHQRSPDGKMTICILLALVARLASFVVKMQAAKAIYVLASSWAVVVANRGH